MLRIARIADLCKGSTADSDSVCLGSNPSSAAIGPEYISGLFYRGVAQFGSALRSGRRGRRFKSCHLDHRKRGILSDVSFSISSSKGEVTGFEGERAKRQA